MPPAQYVTGTPAWRLPSRSAHAAVNYTALTGYDLLAFAYIGKALPRARIVLTSFLAYAISNNVGFAMLSGASGEPLLYAVGVTARSSGELPRSLYWLHDSCWTWSGWGGLSLVVDLPPGTTSGLLTRSGGGRMFPPGCRRPTSRRRSCAGAPFVSRSFQLPMPCLSSPRGRP